jgi:hypothetical protein
MKKVSDWLFKLRERKFEGAKGERHQGPRGI